MSADIVFGFILDHEHAASADENIRPNLRNRAIAALFRHWRATPGTYLVVAGQPHIREGGAVGGIAPNWRTALDLFAFSVDRCQQLAEERGEAFTSRWLTLVEKDRADDIRNIVAVRQLVEGHA